MDNISKEISHIKNREHIVKKFSMYLATIVPKIYIDIIECKSHHKKDFYKNLIFSEMARICFTRQDLMAIYEWMGLPKWDFYQLHYIGKNIFEIMLTYKDNKNESDKIINKIILDLRALSLEQISKK